MHVLLMLILAFGIFASGPPPQPWLDDDLGRSLLEGAADTRHLWLRGQDGAVVRFDRQTGDRIVLGRDVFDLLRDGDRLWAASRAEGTDEVIIIDLRHVERPPIRVDVEGEPVGLFLTGGDRPGLLTHSHVLRPDGNRWRSRALATGFDFGAHPAGVATAADGRLYVGLNKGEWGGGLRRIDPATGSVTLISEPGDELCGGLLNPDCDPVVAVFPDARQPDCMTVGTSLAHMMQRGQVLRVCGDRISAVFAQPIGRTRRGYRQTWAFDNMVETHDGWVAVSRPRYARSRSGVVEMRRTPALKDWAGLRISDEQDGVLFVLEGCCWGMVDRPTDFGVLAVPVEPFD